VFDSKREIGNVVKKLKTNKEREFIKGKFLQENGIHQELQLHSLMSKMV
jgi:hypothetical protein